MRNKKVYTPAVQTFGTFCFVKATGATLYTLYLIYSIDYIIDTLSTP
jgi:hypothetical protein